MRLLKEHLVQSCSKLKGKDSASCTRIALTVKCYECRCTTVSESVKIIETDVFKRGMVIAIGNGQESPSRSKVSQSSGKFQSPESQPHTLSPSGCPSIVKHKLKTAKQPKVEADLPFKGHHIRHTVSPAIIRFLARIFTIHFASVKHHRSDNLTSSILHPVITLHFSEYLMCLHHDLFFLCRSSPSF